MAVGSMKDYQHIDDYFDRIFYTVEAFTGAMFRRLAPALVPLVPAFFFAHAIYKAVYPLMAGYEWFAVVLAVAAGLGLESAGYRSFHLALTVKGTVSKFPPVAYLVIGIGSIIIIEGESTVGIIGVAMFLLTAVVYACVGMSRQIDDKKAEAIEAKEGQTADKLLEFELEQKREDAENRRRIERARAKAAIEADLQVAKPAAISPQPAAELADIPADWRQVTDVQKRRLAAMTRGEREKHFPQLAARTRRSWHERLDEMAA